jgi:uncharacterized membrane protein YebE (DUF533 family)
MFDAKKLLDAMTSAQQAPGAPGADGGLGGVLSNVLGKLGQTGGQQPGASAGSGGGGLGGLLGAVLGQATQGLSGAAQKTGASDAFGRISGGQSTGDLLTKAKDMLGQNQLVGGAALGSLATLFLGTKAGRGLAVNTAKIGGLALVGGLAFQAWQNYQQGKPLVDTGGRAAIDAAPDTSPFGVTSDTQRDDATSAVLIRAMIASASADGVVDEQERVAILGNLQQLGLGPAAAKFLEAEFANPATAEDLAAAVGSPEDGAQVYAAARLTIDPDEPTEQAFLAELAQRLGLDRKLVAHIDAAAEGAKVQRGA